MFVGRAGPHHQTSSDWADAADHEVNNVMELRSYQQQHQQQWYTAFFCCCMEYSLASMNMFRDKSCRNY